MPKGVIYLQTMPVSSDLEEEYHEWYNDTHLAEICSVDGIVSARRNSMGDCGAFMLPKIASATTATPAAFTAASKQPVAVFDAHILAFRIAFRRVTPSRNVT